MNKINTILACSLFFTLASCASYSPPDRGHEMAMNQPDNTNYASRLPQHISSAQKTILIDPKVHAWGAYQNGSLINSGLATAGASWCPDIGRSCKTVAGSFHIYRIGPDDCRSKKYPVGKGGALMPYCMFFNGGFSLHGSTEMAEANISHGCVRLKIPDAEWVRYSFASIGTKVIVQPY